MVYDLGGGTFDVSIVAVEDGVIEVKSSFGNTRLGGDDFDELLIQHVASKFKDAHDVDLLQDIKVKRRLWHVLESAKRRLSDAPEAVVQKEYIWKNHHLSMERLRSEYEEMVRPLILDTMQSVQKALTEAGLLASDLDKAILVGGSSKTPLVHDMLHDFLGLEPEYAINPELIVALGAGIQAGLSSGQHTQAVLVDITSHSFGTSAMGEVGGEWHHGMYVPVIRRSTPIPVTKAEMFSTVMDEQEIVEVKIYEGEEPIAEDNTFIGEFRVEGLSKVPAPNHIQLELSLDLNGILDVTATEKRTGLSKTVQMRLDKEREMPEKSDARAFLDTFSEESAEETNTGDTQQSQVVRAKELKRKAQQLLSEVSEEDAGEIKQLLDECKNHIIQSDYVALEQSGDSLSDMLFYLEE